ncbi:protein of unknown function [Magnetospirillum gryphiswaldense MSR-1 v2]|uniref:Uncharacterized protein n=1 Tax=Magnetospirillum gryphiswaldense (strain DSM 6361 / JCM 21280 / NBRC 15271 / MSR-1) TaxID=431944 RepID=V6EZ90_MAGGM|nr:protein of unknown function [Magnetospirillum gryphiswaldense MSR-1 v2]
MMTCQDKRKTKRIIWREHTQSEQIVISMSGRISRYGEILTETIYEYKIPYKNIITKTYSRHEMQCFNVAPPIDFDIPRPSLQNRSQPNGPNWTPHKNLGVGLILA